jgi:DNA (cytosine-5)-methyltransferase 1
MNSDPTALDLFCGAGGLSAGLIDAGFNVVGAVDTWEPALRSYRANFLDHPVWREDVSAIDGAALHQWNLPAEIDLVAGGPPCQGFSIQRIGADEDSRNDLVLAFGRVVVAARAKTFVMENVPGLLGTRGKALAAHFTRTMMAAGYEVRSAILNAAEHGVPQIRRRVFFVGWRRDLQGTFLFPHPRAVSGQISVNDAIGDLPPPPEDFSAAKHDPLHRRIRLSNLNIKRLSLIPPGGGFEDLPVEMRVNCHRAGAAQIGHRAVYGRLHPDRPAGTITGRFDSFTRGRFAHPSEDRNITLREGARLQGFADKHIFLGTQEEIAAQIGNAIPPPLARNVAASILRQLLCRTGYTLPVDQGELPAFSADMFVAA